ncbi:unnamed protein product, partial [Ectocarpus sp. 12 AP-2014]
HHQLQVVSAVGQRVPTEPQEASEPGKDFKRGDYTFHRPVGGVVARTLTQGNTSKEDTKYLRRTRGLEVFEGSGNYIIQGLRKSPRERSSPRRTCQPT